MLSFYIKGDTMLNKFLKNVSVKQQGLIALIVGFLLLFGSVGHLGITQLFFHIVVIIAAVNLLMWGLEKTEILNQFKKLLK